MLCMLSVMVVWIRESGLDVVNMNERPTEGSPGREENSLSYEAMCLYQR